MLGLQMGSMNNNNMNAFHQRPDCEKQDHLNQVCVLARHKLWRFFFISNVYRACMLLWKRFTIFPRNLSCQRSYFWWKLVDLFFLRFPGRKWKLCRDQSRLTFSSRGLAAWFCARGYAVCACASILACTPMWACSLVRYAQINVYCII